MKWEKFEPGELYKFEVSRIDRKDGKNYFVLRRRGLETRPGWVKQGLVYHVSVLPTQENMELEKFVGQSLKCRVITLKGDFPVLEQCVADGGEHVLTNSQIPNFIESTQQSRKTQLRGVSNGRFGRKKSQESLSKTLHVLNVPKTIELPSEDKWELADVLYPSAPKETPPPTPKKSATAVTATKAQPPATERKTPATHSEVSKSGVAAPVQKSAVERKIEKHALFEQIVQQIEKLDSTLQYKLAKRCLEAADRGNLQAVRNLISAGADVNAKDEDGETALMIAADDGHTAIVQALIAAGADVNARDDEGESALDKARDERRRSTIDALRAAGAR